MSTSVPLLLGIDAGTSGCKAVGLGADGKVCGSGWASYPTSTGADGAVTQHPDDWVVALESSARQALSAATADDVAGISITAPAYNAVLLDGAGRPIDDVVLWSDPRPRGDADELRARYGTRLLAEALVDVRAGTTVSQLCWIRRTRPEQWRRARHILVGKDYLRFVLTGDMATDPGNAASTGLFDPLSSTWLDGLVADLGLDSCQLPEPRPPDDVEATLSGEWATRLGVPPATPVAVGGNDTACELLSVGATDRHSGVIKIASTGTVVVVDDRPHPGFGLLTFPHLDAGHWYTLAATNTAGAALTWLTTNVFGMPSTPANLAEVERLAGSAPPGAEGLLAFPWVTGERCSLWDADVRAAFIGASTRHHQGHFARAVMEAAAFALRDCWDHVHSAGLTLDEPRLTGGGLRSDLWRAIVLGVLGVSARVVAPCEPALGAALLAGRGVGLDINVGRIEDRGLEPDPVLAAEYTRLLARRRELMPSVAALSRRSSS